MVAVQKGAAQERQAQSQRCMSMIRLLSPTKTMFLVVINSEGGEEDEASHRSLAYSRRRPSGPLLILVRCAVHSFGSFFRC